MKSTTKDTILVNGREVAVIRIVRSQEEADKELTVAAKTQGQKRKHKSETKQTTPKKEKPPEELICRVCHKLFGTFSYKEIPEQFTCPHCNTTQPGKSNELAKTRDVKTRDYSILRENNPDTINHAQLRMRGVIWDKFSY